MVAAMLFTAAGLVPVPAQAKCRKDCQQTLNRNARACKTACPKKKAGKACRAGCAAQLKRDRMTCKKATNPTPPTCGGSPTHTVVNGALTATVGRFNYNLQLGLSGASAACSTSFPGSHVCTLAELQGAPASDLTGLRDTAGNVVTSFWAIDSSANPLQQCQDDVVGGSRLNWEYGTAHTASRGEKVDLTNTTGALGAVQTGVQCNISGSSSVACCQ
jgi:hypothetical protein